MLYALISPSNAVDRYSNNIDPTVLTKAGWRWLPVVDTKPAYDSGSQVREGPVVTVNADNVTRVWTVRSKTAAEIDAEKDQIVAEVAVTALGKVLFNHENRIRALNSQAPITAAQFLAAIKALL
jgi:hypothetical protein